MTPAPLRRLLGVLALALAGCGTLADGATCPCNDEIVPVCGENGHTYRNVCLLDCDGVTKGYDGRCRGDPYYWQSCGCNDKYVPVCGTDGATFTNDCQRRCTGTGFAYSGPC